MLKPLKSSKLNNKLNNSSNKRRLSLRSSKKLKSIKMKLKSLNASAIRSLTTTGKDNAVVAVATVPVMTDPKLVVPVVKVVNAVKVVTDLAVVAVTDPKPLSPSTLKVKAKMPKRRKAKLPTDPVAVATVTKAKPVKTLTPLTARTVLAKVNAVTKKVATVRATGAKMVLTTTKKRIRKRDPNVSLSPSPRRNPKSNTKKLVSLLMTTLLKKNPLLLVSSLRKKSVRLKRLLKRTLRTSPTNTTRWLPPRSTIRSIPFLPRLTPTSAFLVSKLPLMLVMNLKPRAREETTVNVTRDLVSPELTTTEVVARVANSLSTTMSSPPYER